MKRNSKNTEKLKDLETIKRFKDLNLIESDVAQDLEESLKVDYEEIFRKELQEQKKKFSEMLDELVKDKPNKAEILDIASKVLKERFEKGLQFQVEINDSVIKNLISERKAKGLPVTFSKKEIMDGFK
ncbi:hypothetical protein [Gillisia sp. CAL575]|uniref:hypothetical protein n=1 Tax=Gillisia sp. CAL575 TaxID=985255 RepID=UPI00055250DF|nr:hypothetical protein [Gillisia sp. CAL575]